MVSTKILSSTFLFNIDNTKKCFLSTKSANKNDFWIEINHILKYFKIENNYFKL